MRKFTLSFVLVLGVLAAAPALAGPYDKVFFVKRGGSPAQMWADRAACAKVAENVGLQRNGEAYGDPDYGMISAMGAALESDSMQNFGKAIRRAALEKCMEKRGWAQLDPTEADEKAVRKASAKDPSALDAWMKAHEPAVVQAKAPPAPAPAAASATVPVPVATATAQPAAPTTPSPTTAGQPPATTTPATLSGLAPPPTSITPVVATASATPKP